MRQRYRFARALRVKNVTAIPAMMFAIGETEGRPTPHTDIRIDPFGGLSAVSRFSFTGRLSTYSATVQHAASYFDLWREVPVFLLKHPVGFADV